MAAALKSLGALLEESPASVQKACEIGDDAMTTITTNLAVYNDCAAAEVRFRGLRKCSVPRCVSKPMSPDR